MVPFVQVILDLQRSVDGRRDRCFCLCGCRLTQGRHDSETGDDPVSDLRGGVKNGSRPPSEKGIGFISRFCRTATAAGHDGLFCPSVTSRLFCQDGVVGSAAGRTVMTGRLAECVAIAGLLCRMYRSWEYRTVRLIPSTLRYSD